jgi:transposase
MTRKRTTLTDAQKNELRVAFDTCRNGSTKIRYQAVLLYANSRIVDDIQEITGCSRTSLLEWWRIYRQEGVAGLIDGRRGGNSAKLTAKQIEHLHGQLRQYTPGELLGEANCQESAQFWTVPELATLVEQTASVVYRSATSYRNLLRKCELSRQRPDRQYKSRSEAKVMDFEEELEKN